jgi:hypothetical protein
MEFDTLQALRQAATEFLDESDFRYYEKLEQFHCTCPISLRDGIIQRLKSNGWHLHREVPNVRKEWNRLIFTFQPREDQPT